MRIQCTCDQCGRSFERYPSQMLTTMFCSRACANTFHAVRGRRSDVERFWAFVDKSAGEQGCWLWTGHRAKWGHGQFHPRGDGEYRPVGAHRYAYELANGPVPDGLVLDHVICSNPPCVNPAHMKSVTNAENVMRSEVAFGAVNARKTHCPAGHPYDIVMANGSRRCRRCSTANMARYAKTRREAKLHSAAPGR